MNESMPPLTNSLIWSIDSSKISDYSNEFGFRLKVTIG
jgi:hypothetical protein